MKEDALFKILIETFLIYNALHLGIGITVTVISPSLRECYKEFLRKHWERKGFVFNLFRLLSPAYLWTVDTKLRSVMITYYLLFTLVTGILLILFSLLVFYGIILSLTS